MIPPTVDELFVLAGGAIDDRGVTLVATHRVPNNAVPEFLTLQAEFRAAEECVAGFAGQELSRPVPGISNVWTSIVRFDSRDDLERWLGSDERRLLTERLAALVDGYDTQVIGRAFGRWFPTEPVSGATTPSWKQWLTVLLVLYPTVMLLGMLTQYLPGGSESDAYPSRDWFFLNLWLGNALSTCVLTYLIMNPTNRVLSFWLRPDASRRATLIGVGLVVALYVVALLTFRTTCAGGCS